MVIVVLAASGAAAVNESDDWVGWVTVLGYFADRPVSHGR